MIFTSYLKFLGALSINPNDKYVTNTEVPLNSLWPLEDMTNRRYFSWTGPLV